jgi:type IV secretory pathway VirB10-like protein
VITSSDDEHESHFLIPGFFKTISNNSHNGKDNEAPSPVQDKEQAEVSGQPAATSKTSPPPPPQSQQSNTPSSPPPPSSSSSQEQQKPSEPPLSSQSQQQNGSSSPPPPSASTEEKKPESASTALKQSSSTSQNDVSKSSANPQQVASLPQSQNAAIQQEDEGIRRILHYYHIDDGDIVEVAGGSLQRLVLVHPERPLPPYILQNKQLLQKLQLGLCLTYFLIEINTHFLCMN